MYQNIAQGGNAFVWKNELVSCLEIRLEYKGIGTYKIYFGSLFLERKRRNMEGKNVYVIKIKGF